MNRLARTSDKGTSNGNHKALYGFLFAYLLIEFVRPQYYVPALGLIRPGLLIGVVLILFSLSKLHSTLTQSTICKLILAFTILCIIWVPFAVNNFHAFNTAKGMFLHTFALVIPLVALVQTKDRLNAIVNLLIAISTYIAIFSLTHVGVGPGSFISDENDVALFILTGLPFCYFKASSPSLPASRKWLLYVCCVVMILGIVATNSRGGFVGLAAIIGCLIWFSKNRTKAVLSVLAVILLSVPFIPETYYAEIESISDDSDGTRLDRFHSWEMGWYMYLDNPVFGVGPQNYAWRVAEYELQLPLDERISQKLHGGRVAHSLYFTLLPELGTSGTVLFFAIVTIVLRNSSRIRKSASLSDPTTADFVLTSQAISASMVGFLIAGTFISVLYYPEFWMLAALSTALTLVWQRLSTVQHAGHTQMNREDSTANASRTNAK